MTTAWSAALMVSSFYCVARCLMWPNADGGVFVKNIVVAQLTWRVMALNRRISNSCVEIASSPHVVVYSM